MQARADAVFGIPGLGARATPRRQEVWVAGVRAGRARRQHVVQAARLAQRAEAAGRGLDDDPRLEDDPCVGDVQPDAVLDAPLDAADDLGSSIWGLKMGSEGSRLAESERGVWF